MIRIAKDNSVVTGGTEENPIVDKDFNDARYTLELIATDASLTAAQQLAASTWDNKVFYKLTGQVLNFDRFDKTTEKKQIFIVAHDKDIDTNPDARVYFYQIALLHNGTNDNYPQEDTINADMFKNLMVESSDGNYYVETHDGHPRTDQSKDAAFWGNGRADYKVQLLKKDKLYINNEDNDHVVTDFLGSRFKVTVKHSGSNLTYWIDDNGTEKQLRVIETKLGRTLEWANGYAKSDIYGALKNVYWNATLTKEPLKHAKVQSSHEVYIDSSDGTYIFTEPTYIVSKVKYNWHELPIQAYQYRLHIEYFELQEISASIGYESDVTLDRYISKLGDTERLIYPLYDDEGNVTGYEERWTDANNVEHAAPVTVTEHYNVNDTGLSILKNGNANLTGTFEGVTGTMAYRPNNAVDVTADGTKYYNLYIVDVDTGDVLAVYDDEYVKEDTNGTLTVVRIALGDSTSITGSEGGRYQIRTGTGSSAVTQPGLWTNAGTTDEHYSWTTTTQSGTVNHGKVFTGTVYKDLSGQKEMFYGTDAAGVQGLYGIFGFRTFVGLDSETNEEIWSDWTFTQLTSTNYNNYLTLTEYVRLMTEEPVNKLLADGNSIPVDGGSNGNAAFCPERLIRTSDPAFDPDADVPASTTLYYECYGAAVIDGQTVVASLADQGLYVSVRGTEISILKLAESNTAEGTYWLTVGGVSKGDWTGTIATITIGEGTDAVSYSGMKYTMAGNGTEYFYCIQDDTVVYATRPSADAGWTIMSTGFTARYLNVIYSDLTVETRPESVMTIPGPARYEENNKTYEMYVTRADYNKALAEVPKRIHLVKGTVYKVDTENPTALTAMNNRQLRDNKEGVYLYENPVPSPAIYTGFTTQALIIRTLTDYFDVVYSRDGKTGSLDFNDKDSYVVYNTDPNSPTRSQLVLRFGSPENPTTMNFIGKITGVELQSTDLPENTIVTKSEDIPCYQLTDTLYLTKSGLVVQINDDVTNPITGNIFASKFDGEVYTSTNVIASGLTGKSDAVTAMEKTIADDERLLADIANLDGLTEEEQYWVSEEIKRFEGMNKDEIIAALESEIETLTAQIPQQMAADTLTCPVITIVKDQVIRPQVLTDHIAVDLNGTYWYYEDDGEGHYNWDEVTSTNGAIEYWYYERNADGSYKLDTNGNKIRKTLAAGSDAPAGSDKEVTVTYNGRKYFESDHRANDDGDIITYYQMPIFKAGGTPNGLIEAGSDGTVTSVDAEFTQRLAKDKNAGTDFMTELISAPSVEEGKGNVIIRLKDLNGSILDGDTAGGITKDDTDIKAGGKLTIYSNSTGKIGTDEDPIEMEFGTYEQNQLDQEGVDSDTEVISTETHMYVENGNMTVDKNIIVDKVIWDVATKDGSIVFAESADAEEPQYTLTVVNGGDAELRTNKQLTTVKDEETEEITDYIYTDNPDAAGAGEIRIKELLVEGSRTEPDTGETIVSTAHFEAGSAASGTGKGNIEIGKVTVGTDEGFTWNDTEFVPAGTPAEGVWEADAVGSIIIGTKVVSGITEADEAPLKIQGRHCSSEGRRRLHDRKHRSN